MTTKISMLAIDLAKGSFQVCAVGPDGTVLYNRALSRIRLAALLAEQPACIVAMAACATSHHWGRVAQRHGHEVRLVPAAYVKPFVKRRKSDRADAEAIERLAEEPEAASRTDATSRRLRTIPGIGPVTAGAVAAFPPDLDTFESGRDFAARLGLVPRQRSTGGKVRLGAVGKMGRTDIRRLPIVGAISVIRWVVRKGGRPNRRLAAFVARKPETVAAVAPANGTARTIRAVTTRQEDHRMA